MSSRELVFAVGPGPSPEQLEAAVEAYGDSDDAWATAYSSRTVPEFPTRLVFEGRAREAFSKVAVKHLALSLGVEIITPVELERRFGHRYPTPGLHVRSA